MDEATWVGVGLRAVISVGVLFLGAGLASRVCKGTLAWSIATTFYGCLFVYMLVGVVPQPNEAGLLYAIQWGAFGATLYCIARALRWVGPMGRARAAEPEGDA